MRLAPKTAGVLTAVLASALGCTVVEQSTPAWPAEMCGEGPLAPPPQEVTSERAAACERLMQEGRVALVVFGDIGKTPEELEQDARAIEKIVGMATGNMVNVTVDIVRASPEAEARQKESLSGIFGCIDYNTSLSPAQIADETMQLQAYYSSIVGIGPWMACDWGVGGGHTPDGRYSNVHMGGLELGQLPARDAVGSPVALVAAHEILHQFGIKHNSVLEDPRLPEFGGVLDVRALVDGKRVGMHGLDNSIMTSDLAYKVDIKDVKPSPVDMNTLQILRGGQPYATEITHEVVFDVTSYTRQYFTLQLSRPITFSDYARKDENGSKQFVAFDQLIVVPVLAEDGRKFVGFEIGYASEGEVVWHKGDVLRKATSPNSMILHDGEQQVELFINETDGTIGARPLRFAIF